MSQSPAPKKPRKPKSKKLNISDRKIWENILKEVEKHDVPINFLEGLTVNLRDGTCVDIDVKELLKEGIEPEALQALINEKLDALDDFIDDVDFFISVDEVRKTVQPATDQLLKNL